MPSKAIARGQIDEPPMLEASASSDEQLPHCKVTFKISKQSVTESHSGNNDFSEEEEHLARRYLSLSETFLHDKKAEESNQYLKKALAICPQGELRNEISQRIGQNQIRTVGMTPPAN